MTLLFRVFRPILLVATTLVAGPHVVSAQVPGGRIGGRVFDSTSAVLPGVSVLLSRAGTPVQSALTDGSGTYSFTGVAAGRYDLTFTLINFATHMRRGVEIDHGDNVSLDAVLHLTLTADVTVTGRRTVENLATAAREADDVRAGHAVAHVEPSDGGQQLSAFQGHGARERAGRI